MMNVPPKLDDSESFRSLSTCSSSVTSLISTDVTSLSSLTSESFSVTSINEEEIHPPSLLIVSNHNVNEDTSPSSTKLIESKKEPLTSLAVKLEVEKDCDSYEVLQRKPLVCGHRGVLYTSLENTLHSIQMAPEIGCDEVEMDVFVLKCGTVIVFHGLYDEGLLDEYSTNMTGPVEDFTYNEIRHKVKFNPFFEEFGCGPDAIYSLEQAGLCYVPTLEEVLTELKKTDITIRIEFKGPNTTEPTLAVVEKLDMVDQVHFSSFEFDRIERLRELRPQRDTITGDYVYKTAALFRDDIPTNFIEIVTNLGVNEVHLKYDTCTKSRISEIHAAGMGSMCWLRGPIGMKEDTADKYYDIGMEDERLFNILKATGLKKICTNRPQVLIEMNKRKKL